MPFFRGLIELLSPCAKTLALLELNPHHPSLRMHALSGRLTGMHSVSINLAYRITPWLQTQDAHIIPINEGTTLPKLNPPRQPVRLEAQIGHFAFFSTRRFGVVQAANLQGFFALLAASANAFDLHAAGVSRRTGQSVFGL